MVQNDKQRDSSAPADASAQDDRQRDQDDNDSAALTQDDKKEGSFGSG